MIPPLNPQLQQLADILEGLHDLDNYESPLSHELTKLEEDTLEFNKLSELIDQEEVEKRGEYKLKKKNADHQIKKIYKDQLIINLLQQVSKTARKIIYIRIYELSFKKGEPIESILSIYRKMKWDSKEVKNEILSRLAKKLLILRKGIEEGSDHLVVGEEKIKVLTLSFDSFPLFGHGDHTQKKVSRYVANAIGAIVKKKNLKMLDLKKRFVGCTFPTDILPSAISFEIIPYSETKISAKTIRPILPHLQGLQSLVRFALYAFEDTLIDDDVWVLKNIILTGSEFIQIQINLEKMSKNSKRELLDTGKVRETRC